MYDLDYGTKAVDQLAIFVPKVFERRLPFQKYSDDVLWRLAVLELICGGMFCNINSGLVGIAVERCIEDGLKVGGGCGC
jgi:hypothetical protein